MLPIFGLDGFLEQFDGWLEAFSDWNFYELVQCAWVKFSAIIALTFIFLCLSPAIANTVDTLQLPLLYILKLTWVDI